MSLYLNSHALWPDKKTHLPNIQIAQTENYTKQDTKKNALTEWKRFIRNVFCNLQYVLYYRSVTQENCRSAEPLIADVDSAIKLIPVIKSKYVSRPARVCKKI
jgi:hypothetical protein